MKTVISSLQKEELKFQFHLLGSERLAARWLFCFCDKLTFRSPLLLFCSFQPRLHASICPSSCNFPKLLLKFKSIQVWKAPNSPPASDRPSPATIPRWWALVLTWSSSGLFSAQILDGEMKPSVLSTALQLPRFQNKEPNTLGSRLRSCRFVLAARRETGKPKLFPRRPDWTILLTAQQTFSVLYPFLPRVASSPTIV